jgi:diguanylate cyclase (GGDEF)-like protein
MSLSLRTLAASGNLLAALSLAALVAGSVLAGRAIEAGGGVAGIVVLVTDVSAMKTVERELQHIARLDTLTQLPNRRQLDETLAQTLQSLPRRNGHAALLFLDIDLFKSINDTHGHAAGDAVLVEFAARLTAAVRSSDTVARLGGDELVVLVEGLTNELAEATLIAEKIRTQLRRPMAIGELEVVVTSSIGIALINEPDLSPSAVMERADQALYQAKHAGRNTFAVFDAGMAASQDIGAAGDAQAAGDRTPG